MQTFVPFIRHALPLVLFWFTIRTGPLLIMGWLCVVDHGAGFGLIRDSNRTVITSSVNVWAVIRTVIAIDIMKTSGQYVH